MKKWYNNIISKYPILKYLSNKYVVVLLFFIFWILFLDSTSYLVQQDINDQIDELESNKKYYQEEISKDNKNIKKLKNTDQVEKYAREKYYMKRDSEDIYIIEYEEDEIRKKDSLAKIK